MVFFMLVCDHLRDIKLEKGFFTLHFKIIIHLILDEPKTSPKTSSKMDVKK